MYKAEAVGEDGACRNLGLHEHVMAQFITKRAIDTIQSILHVDHPHIS